MEAKKYYGVTKNKGVGFMISNVSFVVVAKNEEFGIDKCLASLSKMQLNDCEIICVDSGSTDDTLSVMKRYAANSSIIQIYQCKGYVNSAIARNVGLKHISKKNIFFVDGDVELNQDFIVEALEIINSGKATIVTGQLSEIYYTSDYSKEVRRVVDRFSINEEKKVYLSGGCFIVGASLLKKVGLWDEQMDRNQDIDFTLRLSRGGYFLAIPISMGTHHTLSYSERPWLHVKKRYPMYFGMLIRKNLDRPRAVLSLLKQNRGFLAGFAVYGLFFVGILATAFLSIPFLYVLLAFSFMVITDLFWGAIRKKNVFNHFLTHYLHILLIVIGIFMPINNKRVSTTVKQINLS